jgi:hypothetical protein
MLVGMARVGDALNPGDVYECEDGEAKRLVEAGFAVDLDQKAKQQKRAKPETAAKNVN